MADLDKHLNRSQSHLVVHVWNNEQIPCTLTFMLEIANL